MSLLSFQRCVARLATDADFQRAVRRHGGAALGPGLEAGERARLVALAYDPGTRLTRTMYRGFRLSKLHATVPLLCRVLGRRLTTCVLRYFAECRPFTFYFADEGVAFCDFIIASPPSRPCPRLLQDVARYERAGLLLTMGAADGRSERIAVPFAHDPGAVLAWACGRQRAPRPAPTPMCAWWDGTTVRWQPMRRPRQPSATSQRAAC